MIDGKFVCIFWGVLMMHGDVLDTLLRLVLFLIYPNLECEFMLLLDS